MSSAIATPQSYFCYQCNDTVTLTPSLNSDLSCPNCNGGFLEEQSISDPPPPNPNSSIYPDPFSLFADSFFSRGPGPGPVLFSSTTIDLQNPTSFSPFLLSPSSSSSPSPSAFNPFDFLQNYLQNLRDSGANVQFVVDNHGGGVGGGTNNLGDYFLGPGLEQLIQQLAENDPNRYGTPPASKQAIDGLPDVVITVETVNSDSNSCAVCMDEFEVGSKSKQMPCNHLFHSDCLIPWLQLHNSCPVCRHELPTDDPDYETRRGGSGGGQGGRGQESSEIENVGGGGGGGGGGRTFERRFSISLPWPFSGRGSGSSEGNNSGSSSGVQRGGGGGSEPRQESLD